jgi:hypothetical protein
MNMNRGAGYLSKSGYFNVNAYAGNVRVMGCMSKTAGPNGARCGHHGNFVRIMTPVHINNCDCERSQRIGAVLIVRVPEPPGYA